MVNYPSHDVWISQYCLNPDIGQEIKQVKFSHAEELKVKGHTKEGVAEPVTVADTNSNEVGLG